MSWAIGAVDSVDCTEAGSAVALALAAYPVTVRTLGDRGWLVVSLCLALPGYAAWFAVRGELAGQGRLSRYGAQLVVDGASRLVGAGVLVLVDETTTAAFGLLFGLSPWVTLALTLPGWRISPEDRTTGPPLPMGERRAEAADTVADPPEPKKK